MNRPGQNCELMTPESVHRSVIRSLEKLYDRNLIENIHRGDYVEHMVAVALGKPWEVTGPWDSWDLHHPHSEARIEVKQSAAVQTWTAGMSSTESTPRFDIKPRTGYWRSR